MSKVRFHPSTRLSGAGSGGPGELNSLWFFPNLGLCPGQSTTLDSAEGSLVPRTSKLRGNEGDDRSGRRDRSHLGEHGQGDGVSRDEGRGGGTEWTVSR